MASPQPDPIDKQPTDAGTAEPSAGQPNAVGGQAAAGRHRHRQPAPGSEIHELLDQRLEAIQDKSDTKRLKRGWSWRDLFFWRGRSAP